MVRFLFYCADYCPFAQRVWIALEFCKLEYTYVETNVWSLRLPNTQAFRDRSRSRTMPTLFVEDSQQSYDDSLPILQYIDRLSGGKLMPENPARAYAVQRVINNEVRDYISSFYGFLGAKSSFAQTEHGRLEKMTASIEALDAAVGCGLADTGEPITMADMAVFPFVERAFHSKLLTTFRGLSLDRDSHPKLASWLERLLTLPAVQATLWTHRTAASLQTQPYPGAPGQSRLEYLNDFYRKYADNNVAEVNAGLVNMRPPTFDMEEWERLGEAHKHSDSGESYTAVPPGGSNERNKRGREAAPAIHEHAARRRSHDFLT